MNIMIYSSSSTIYNQVVPVW